MIVEDDAVDDDLGIGHRRKNVRRRVEAKKNAKSNFNNPNVDSIRSRSGAAEGNPKDMPVSDEYAKRVSTMWWCMLPFHRQWNSQVP